jgi:hypothetical protein
LVLGLGFWGLAPTPKPPIPNPQSPIPNPHAIYFINFSLLLLNFLFNVSYYNTIKYK